MTITSPAPAPASTAADWELAERVSQHMQTHFPDTMAAAGWLVARDERDNTAVVVAQPGYDNTLPGGCRAIHLFRWHTSLGNAGFLSEPRTDMEVFGRPEDQSPDGRARWLHITGWDPARIVPERSIPELIGELTRKIGLLPEHWVVLGEGEDRLVDTIFGGQVRPDTAVFKYAPDGSIGVTVYAGEAGYSVSNAKVPDWLLTIGDNHRGHIGEQSWCYLGDCTGLEAS
jgi:hypothetical protein